MDGFPSIKQIRRSLSRSPSKPSRFQLHSKLSDSPGSPMSPLALSRAFSPRSSKDASPSGAHPGSPLAQAPTTTKKKFSLRRNAPFRATPRTRPASKSPRRALADSTGQGNSTPFTSRRNSGEENRNVTARAPLFADQPETECKPSVPRFSLDDGPIKFEFARSRGDSCAPGANCLMPAKSSPLKRSDGIMNLDQASLGSPVAKRRSLHGASFGPDFDVFDHGPTPNSEQPQHFRNQDHDMGLHSFSSPIQKTGSPLRKSLSLRKSTLSQRYGSNNSRLKAQEQGHEFAIPGQAASRTRNRMSLDSSIGFGSPQSQSPFRKSMGLGMGSESGRSNTQPFMRGGASSFHQPHPLSNALTPSSSMSSLGDGSPTHAPVPHPHPAPPTVAPRQHVFSRSLPLGATRPDLQAELNSENASFATPAAYKMAKPLPQAFMSTGLISKRNRNADLPQPGSYASYAMPDTPSKRASFPPITSSPSSLRGFAKSIARHEFGTPTTPFSLHPANATPISFGKGVNIFGTLGNPSLNRRGSFASIASIEGDDNSLSPSGKMDSQSSVDDMPPTPTKQGDGAGRRSKENSLRSSLFGRRISLGADTFTPPTTLGLESPTQEKTGKLFLLGTAGSPVEDRGDPMLHGSPKSSPSPNASPTSVALSFARSRLLRQSQMKPLPEPLSRSTMRPWLSPHDALNITKKSPLCAVTPTESTSPHTPSECVVPPDASGLTISGRANRRGSIPFNASTNSNLSFPPATPTTNRDSKSFFQNGQPAIAPITGLTKNDVDTALTSRFHNVSLYGNGEFSQVYRVEGAMNPSPGSSKSVWAVKKTKRPYAGMKDRERKLREVQILQTLGGNEHVISFAGSWEQKNHLYIQTEFCENGNLKDFLTQAGYKGRLDDFRIWKILLELSLVVGFNPFE
jgi:mitosis inhibitor protein kinase SWE1